ncbi:MAG: hypothetical protein LBB90_09235 [Tannerella sp.]|jgi:hypothetical protein|nr:hypothetical protein [Tannerella sp.]
MKQTWLNAGKWMLAALFMSYYVSATCFYHTHYFSWGSVTHSHFFYPFDDSPVQHSHTPSQCQTIYFLSHLVLVLAVAAVFYGAVQVCRFYLPVCYGNAFRLLIASPLRAPPALK